MESEYHNPEYKAKFDKGAALVSGSIQLDGQQLKSLGFFEKIRLKKALKIFREASLLAPKNAAPLLFIAKIHERLGERVEYLESLKRANVLEPDNLILAIETGAALGQLGRHREAVALLEVASRSHPYEPRILCNLGLSYMMAGEAENAERTFELLVRFEPDVATNQKLLNLAAAVRVGKKPTPRSESEIVRMM